MRRHTTSDIRTWHRRARQLTARAQLLAAEAPTWQRASAELEARRYALGVEMLWHSEGVVLSTMTGEAVSA